MLSDTQKDGIIFDAKSGELSAQEIANKYGISRQYVYKLLNEKGVEVVKRYARKDVKLIINDMNYTVSDIAPGTLSDFYVKIITDVINYVNIQKQSLEALDDMLHDMLKMVVEFEDGEQL